MNGPSLSMRIGLYCRWGVLRRCIQGNTFYMFEEFGVDGILYMEVILSWWFYGEASKLTTKPGVT